jgi:hypothetical protein
VLIVGEPPIDKDERFAPISNTTEPFVECMIPSVKLRANSPVSKIEVLGKRPEIDVLFIWILLLAIWLPDFLQHNIARHINYIVDKNIQNYL